MKAIKGPAVFLAQFAGDAPPFNSLPTIADWAAQLGFKGVQIPTWDRRLFDLEQAAEVVQASSGASWIFGDRMPRALAGDYTPKAAARVLLKDVGLFVHAARQLGLTAPMAECAPALNGMTCSVTAGWSATSIRCSSCPRTISRLPTGRRSAASSMTTHSCGASGRRRISCLLARSSPRRASR